MQAARRRERETRVVGHKTKHARQGKPERLFARPQRLFHSARAGMQQAGGIEPELGYAGRIGAPVFAVNDLRRRDQRQPL